MNYNELHDEYMTLQSLGVVSRNTTFEDWLIDNDIC